MITNEYTLMDLRDIVPPDAISWWPLAPSVSVLLMGALIVIAWLVFRASKTRRLNAYRVAALDELKQATTTLEIASIIRRTALMAWPRAEIIVRSDADWIEWLETTGGFAWAADSKQALTDLYARPTPAPSSLKTDAEKWIKSHASL